MHFIADFFILVAYQFWVFKKPSKEPLFVGTLVHPNGNISELLLKEGFAKCVDWSLGMMTG